MFQRVLISLLCALFLGAAVVIAQSPEPTAPVPPGGDSTTATRQSSTPPGNPDSSGPQLPPDDYEASEQISEDLSVSFPVDI